MKTLKSLLITALLISSCMFYSCTTGTPKENETEKKEEKGNVVIENILSRKSVRNYTDQKITEEQFDIMLRAAMAAPSAQNRQPWCFIIVDDRALLETMGTSEILPYSKMTGKAAAAIIVCCDKEKAGTNGESGFWVQDCSAATQNLLLAAESLGLGAVWNGLFPVTERSDYVKEVLSLPDNIIPFALVPMGYPAGEEKPKDKYNPEIIHKNGW
ncbi:MAG: nitroreductase family protein [Bacteroidales bacterium]|jgi:nitroreductase|nr:nitroreductase family protein [Bacteroidales bacterium]